MLSCGTVQGICTLTLNPSVFLIYPLIYPLIYILIYILITKYTATLMRVPNVWNIASICSVITMVLAFLFVLAYIDPSTLDVDPEIFVLIGFATWILFIFIPFPGLKATKRFLWRSILKQVISPFSTVEFIDFFLADQWYVICEHVF